jgi:hypothetical protein
MNLLILSFLFMNIFAWADCKMSNGSAQVSIPENKEISLFESGKSLSTHKIQDQDGLGTCYANATSAVLKSVLPNNPDISYVHAALQSSTNGWLQNWSDGKNNYIKSDNSDLTSGGFFCDTVSALKKSGGACSVKHSILENKQLMDSNVQVELMKGLGTYFDSVNKVKNDPAKLQKLKQNLAKVIDSVNMEKSKVIQACEAEKRKEIPIKKALDEALSLEILSIDFSDPCGKFKALKFKEMLGVQSIITEDRIKLVIPPSLEGEFNIFLGKNLDLKSALINNLKNNKDKPLEDMNFQSKLGTKISEFLNHKLTSIPSKNSSCSSESPIRKIQSNPEQMGAVFYNGIINQKSDVCNAYFENSEIIEAAKKSNINQCIPVTQLDEMLNALAPIMKIGEKLDQSLVDKMNNPLSQYGKQLKDLLLPGCIDKTHLINMKSISCASFSMCDKSQYLDMSNTTYTGPKGGCYDIGSARAIIRMKVLNNISTNRALGISVCTAFMDNPAARTNFCQTPVQGVEGHSNHEMTISGYRCKNGKVEYQILNSWGKYSGCPVNDGDKNSAIECSLDKEGNRDGKFWVKEDVLVDSTNEISQLSTK